MPKVLAKRFPSIYSKSYFFVWVKHECPYETFCVCKRASIDTNLNIYVVEQVQSQIISETCSGWIPSAESARLSGVFPWILTACFFQTLGNTMKCQCVQDAQSIIQMKYDKSDPIHRPILSPIPHHTETSSQMLWLDLKWDMQSGLFSVTSQYMQVHVIRLLWYACQV